MRLSEILLPELKIEATTTRKTLERVPGPSLGWRPHERSRTLGELSVHIAHLPGLFIASLAADEFDHDTHSAPEITVPEILDAFDRNVTKAESVLGSLSNEQLFGHWRYRYGTRVIFDMPRLVVIRSTALNHLIHHRGQLSVYLRLLNVPLPSVYGPTADES